MASSSATAWAEGGQFNGPPSFSATIGYRACMTWQMTPWSPRYSLTPSMAPTITPPAGPVQHTAAHGASASGSSAVHSRGDCGTIVRQCPLRPSTRRSAHGPTYHTATPPTASAAGDPGNGSLGLLRRRPHLEAYHRLRRYRGAGNTDPPGGGRTGPTDGRRCAARLPGSQRPGTRATHHDRSHRGRGCRTGRYAGGAGAGDASPVALWVQHGVACRAAL